MTYTSIEQQIAEAWNAQADEYNQWDELDLGEKIEWAAKWGASLRTQVVLEGYALISKDTLRTWGKLEIVEQACCYPISVAPHPPEVEPVQMPEPSAWMLGYQTMGGDVGWKLSWSKSGAGVCHRLSDEEFEQPLYTEHQVRQLLTQHGIK